MFYSVSRTERSEEKKQRQRKEGENERQGGGLRLQGVDDRQADGVMEDDRTEA